MSIKRQLAEAIEQLPEPASLEEAIEQLYRALKLKHPGQSTPPSGSTADRGPRTPLGRRLMAIREEIVRSGEPLLGWAEIERETAARRGGIEDAR